MPIEPALSHSAARSASVPTPPVRLVVMVPCLDEEHTVGGVVAAVPRAISGVDRVLVVVLDDGSADATRQRALEAGAEVVSNPRNLGLGRTFRRGVEEALARGADVVVNIDGDGQFDPADIPRLVAPVLAGQAAMATASRFLDPVLVPEMPVVKRWGNRWVARIVRLLTGRRFADVSCGFRAFSREALLRMNLFGGFTYTQETFLDLAFKDLPIVEVPIAVRGTREHGTSRIAASIPRYAVRSLQIMLRAFMGYRPFSTFASVAAVLFAGAAALLGFLLVHYLRAGAFSPHIWAGFVGGSLALVGLLTLIIGLLGDVLVRIRMNQEQILYLLRRDAHTRGRHAGRP